MQTVTNTSQRPITLTLRPGSLAVRGDAGTPSAKITLDPARSLADKPIDGTSSMTIAEMAKRTGVDAKDIRDQLGKSKTFAALQADGTIRVS